MSRNIKEKKERGEQNYVIGSSWILLCDPSPSSQQIHFIFENCVKSTKVAGFPVCISLEKDKRHRGADRTKGPKESNASRAYGNDRWSVDGLHTGNDTLGVFTEGPHRMSSRI